MKTILMIILIFLAIFLRANPVEPVCLSELYFDDGNWILEIYDYYQGFELYNLDGCYLATSTDSVYFNPGINFNENGVFVVDEFDLQSSLAINPSSDTIMLGGVEIYFYDEISFGNHINPPTTGQSLARIALDGGPPMGITFFLLAKENLPTIGSDPFSVSSYGTFTGYVYDSLMNPFENVQLEYIPGLGYGAPEIITDEDGYFNADLPGMNYEFNIHLAALASLDTIITIEPDSIHFYEFIFENYVVGINEPEVVISIHDYHLSNHPNPFNPETTIHFNTDIHKKAEVIIYNSKGQKVDYLLINSDQSSIVWNAKEIPSGVYLYKLIVGGKEVTSNKMLLLK